MQTTNTQVDRFYGLVRFLRVSHLLLWMMWAIYRERRRVVCAHAQGNSAVRPESDVLVEVFIAFRETALELGVLMIKLGQFLSSRPDLLPEIGRAVGTLVGISTGLVPEFDFVEVAIPYARKFLGLDAEGAKQTLKQLFSQVLDAGRAWLSLPRSLEQVMTKLETGQIEVKLASNGPRGRRSGRNSSDPSSVGSFTWLFICIASLAGGVFLLTDTHQFIAGWFCLGLAGLATLRLSVKG